ncbi:MAG TPA: TIGR03013 family XrtA/PEP-CTERM system glycosyltransferase [Candidatus Acidoferrum sp.]
MIRLLNAYFPSRTIFLGVSEACLVTLAFLVATVLRFGKDDATVMLRYEQGLFKILVVAGVFITCMYYFDLYDTSILSNRREVTIRLIQVPGIMCIFLAAIYYLFPQLKLGRGITIIGLLFVLVALIVWRGLFFALNGQPQFAQRTMIFGDEPFVSRLHRELGSRPELGVRVIGHVLPAGKGSFDFLSKLPSGTVRSEGKINESEFLEAIEQQRVSRIIIALEDRRERLPLELLLHMKSHGMVIQDGAELYEQITGKIPIESLRLGTLLFSSGFRVSQFLVIYKRMASIMVSIFGLLLGLPVLPFVALAIKLSSPGSLLYKQKRTGKDNKTFYCYKFRTMRADAEADTGPTWAGDEDPRITKVGHFLRMSRLDEIPQLWNVLRGDMSLVGPRPERPEFIEWLQKEIPYYNLRHTVRPGITGWAQIRYKYGNTVEDTREKLRYDLFYIKNMSPGLDVLVLFDTVKTILLRRGAK